MLETLKKIVTKCCGESFVHCRVIFFFFFFFFLGGGGGGVNTVMNGTALFLPCPRGSICSD